LFRGVTESDWLFTDQLGFAGMFGIPLLVCVAAVALGLRANRPGRRLPGILAVVAALPGLLVFGFFFVFFIVLGASR
jgi:nitrogen fixation/metabolism regulation signal transduction histidine kinase